MAPLHALECEYFGKHRSPNCRPNSPAMVRQDDALTGSKYQGINVAPPVDAGFIVLAVRGLQESMISARRRLP